MSIVYKDKSPKSNYAKRVVAYLNPYISYADGYTYETKIKNIKEKSQDRKEFSNLYHRIEGS